MLRPGRKAHIALGAELALGLALGRPAPVLAAGKVDLQISVAAVVLKGCALGIAQVGVHHIDKDFFAVNDGLAIFQRVQRVAVQPVDGRVQIGVQPLVARNIIKRIYEHPALLYSSATAASIIRCASATTASSSGIRFGSGARTPPSSRPYMRRRISFCTAYRLPWASHIL